MSIKYVIRKFALGVGDKTVASSKADFDTLTEAVNGLVLGLAIEEKFDVLIANFAELERDLLAVSLDDMIYDNENVRLAARDDRMLFNRRLSNLLSSGKTYRDQIKADLNSGAPWKAMGMKAWAEGTMSQAALNHVEFRACEALRNAAQHQQMPVSSMSRNWKRGDEGVCFSTILSARLSSFSPKRERNKQLEQELWPQFAPDKQKKRSYKGEKSVLLMPIVRRYIDILAEIHMELREKLSKTIESWESFVQQQIQKAEPVLGEPVDLYALVGEDERGIAHEHLYLPSKLAILRRSVVKRTSGLQRLADRYVAGRTP